MISQQTSPAELSFISTFSNNVLGRYGLDVNATDPLCQIWQHEGQSPQFLIDLICAPFRTDADNRQTLNTYSIPTVVEYLKRSHKEYLEKRIPEIERSLEIVTEGLEPESIFGVVLNSYFNGYKNHLVEHIAVEEEKLFPYALHICHHEALTPKQAIELEHYSSVQFLSEHNHEEMKLNTIIQLFKTYQPSSVNATPFRLLMQRIGALSEDMVIHELLEDQVLVVKLMELEIQ